MRLDGQKPDVTAVAAMAEAMAPRGPDGSGVWSQGRVALGHRRLSIIDLSDAGSQPMVDSELGLTVVFNGCIYNYQELRAELERPRLPLLLHLRHRGDRSRRTTTGATRFVDHFLGMFAFAIVERDSGRLVLGRDRLGIKPLYLDTRRRGALRFASTLPALLAGGGVDTDASTRSRCTTT